MGREICLFTNRTFTIRRKKYMERILVIILASLFGTAFYYWCDFMLKKASAQEYVRQRIYLHPNAICYWRTGLAFIGDYLYFCAPFQSTAIFIYTFAAILDGVDGLVARRCNLISKKGEFLDPLCDKLTYLPPLFGFSLLGIMSFNLVLTITYIEFFGQFFARKVLDWFGFSIAANNFGKIKAIIFFALIIYAALLNANRDFINLCDDILITGIVLSLSSIVFKFIPNRLYADILSMLNLCCGIISIVLANSGHLVWAIIAIMTGQIFDLFDGRMAEKHGGTKVGPYLDDIADFVSFGISTANIIYLYGGKHSLIIAYYFAIGVAYRLIRFVMVDKKKKDLPHGIFNGLPSPAGALIVLGSALFFNPAWLSLATVLSIGLMVSHVRFAHFGRMVLKKVPKPIFFTLGAIMIIILVYITKTKSVTLFGYFILLSVTAYMLVGRKMALNSIKAYKLSHT
jgi:CDP-diacylglycerol--serine O-phosphatidyltransferase